MSGMFSTVIMKNKSIWVWALFYLVLISLLVVFTIKVILPVYKSPHSRLWSSSFGYPAMMRSLDEAIPIEVTIVGLRNGSQLISGVGKITYLNLVPINVEESGLVMGLDVVPGDSVRQGEILLRLNTGGYNARISQLELDQSKLHLNQSRKDLQREEEAYLKGIISLSDLEQFKQAFEKARIAFKRARENHQNVTKSRSKSVLTNNSIRAKIQTDSEVIEIISPISGVLISQNVFHGENLIGPRNKVMIVGDKLVLQVSFDQHYFSDINIGTEAKFFLGARQGKEFSGKVIKIDKRIVTEGQAKRQGLPVFSFMTWLEIDNKLDEKTLFAEGMAGYAVVEFPFSSLAIPERALLRFSGRKGMVMLVTEANRLDIVPVSYSVTTDGWVNITSGLSMGDRVVTSGQTGLQANDRVTYQ